MSQIARSLIDVKGVAEATAARLSAAGIDTVETLARASIKKLSSVPGFRPARATAVRAAALALLKQDGRSATSAGKKKPKTDKAKAKKRGKGDKAKRRKKAKGGEKSKSKGKKKEKGGKKGKAKNKDKTKKKN